MGCTSLDLTCMGLMIVATRRLRARVEELFPAGGASYWGRRAFERHFREWRHENGMRALGITNSKGGSILTKRRAV